MRKILVCCSVIGALAVASPAYATGHGHGKGGHKQDHTCQGGHNCNTTTPPAPPAPSPTSSTQTTTVNVNNTTNVTNSVTVQAQAPAATCPICSSPPRPPVVKPVAGPEHRKHCRKIRVVRYRKVWHSGRNRCGDYVRWYTYKKVHRKRKVCVS